MRYVDSLQNRIEEAKLLQNDLVKNLTLRPFRLGEGIIAGIDVSYKGDLMFCSIVLLGFPSLTLLQVYNDKEEADFPYIPGFLSFREMPVILKTFQKVKEKISLIFCDGQGIAHPRGLGLASHIGIELGIPSIGCAKSRLVGEYIEPPASRGAYSDLVFRDKIVGAVLRSRETCRPIFVSPGNLIDIPSSIRYALLVSRYRIPEPIRLAHKYVTLFRNK